LKFYIFYVFIIKTVFVFYFLKFNIFIIFWDIFFINLWKCIIYCFTFFILKLLLLSKKRK